MNRRGFIGTIAAAVGAAILGPVLPRVAQQVAPVGVRVGTILKRLKAGKWYRFTLESQAPGIFSALLKLDKDDGIGDKHANIGLVLHTPEAGSADLVIPYDAEITGIEIMNEGGDAQYISKLEVREMP